MTAEDQQTENKPAGTPKRQIKWLRALLATALLVVLLVVGTVTLLFTVESETLKPIVEKIVTRVTGRSFILEGNVEADFGRLITVRADGVKMANAVWGNEPYMLTIDQPYVVLDFWALTRGQILLRDVTVDSARLLFEENPAGTLNWELGDDEPDDEPLTAIPLLLERAALKDVRIELDLPVFKKPLRILVDSAKQLNREDDDILDLVIAGSVNDHPVDITGRIGPFTTLLVGLDVDYQIDAKADYLTLTSKGHFDSLIAPKKPQLELELQGADATKLTELLGMREITRGPVSLTASMKPAGNGFKATIDGDLGEFLLDLSADLKALNTVKGLKLDVNASGPDLSVAGAVIGVMGLPTDPYTLTGQIEETGGGLIFKDLALRSGESFAKLDGVLPEFPKLKGASLTAGIKARDYLQFLKILGLSDTSELAAIPFEFSGELKKTDQGTEIVEMLVTLGKVTGRISGPITDYPDFIGTRVDFEVRGPDIQTVSKALGLIGILEAPFAGKGNVEITNMGWLLHQSKFDIGKSTASVTGLLGYDGLVRDTDLKFVYTGDLASFARVAGLPDLFPKVNYELSFGLKATRNGIELDDLKATIDGDSKLNVSGLLGMLPSTDGMDLKVLASAPQAKPLMPPQFQQYPIPKGAFQLSGRVRKVPAGFGLDKVITSIGNNRLNLSGTVGAQGSLAGTDLKFSGSGPNLAELLAAEFTRDLDIASSAFDISGEVRISETNLFLKRLAFTAAHGRINGDINLVLENMPYAGSFSLEANGTDLDEMIPNTPRFEPASVPFEARTKGAWNKESILVEKLDIAIDGTTIDLHGELDLRPEMQAHNIVLSAKGSSLARLGRLDGHPLVDKPFDLEAKLEGGTHTVQIEHLTAHVGDSDVTGQFQLDIKDKPTATVRLTSKKMDLAQFFPKSTDEGADDTTTQSATPNEPAEKKPQEKTDDYVRLISDLPIPFQTLNSFDLILNADVDTLIYPKLTLSKLDLDAKLMDGDLTVEKWSADTEQGSFITQLSLTTKGNTANISISLIGREVVLGLGNVSKDDAENYPPSDIALKMTASGASLHELVASLNGYVDVITKPGRIQNVNTLALFGDLFKKLVSTLNPFSKRDPYTKITCAANFANVADGILTIDPGAVMQTDKINIFAEGSVDLNTEKLDVYFHTAARKGIGISAGEFLTPFTRIGGTLAEPKLKLTAKGAGLEGGAAYATGGLSVVAKSLWGRWFATKHPCRKLIKKAKKEGRAINAVE